MRRKRFLLWAVCLLLALTGCGTNAAPSPTAAPEPSPSLVVPGEEWTELEPGLSAAAWDGDYGFDRFLAQGGAASDREVMGFLQRELLDGSGGLSLETVGFGCSTLSVPSGDGGMLFGRNFDWNACDALIVSTRPENGYASISTVNLDFLSGYRSVLDQLPDHAVTAAAIYAPLDGMNEKGLCAAVLMIQDNAGIGQDAGRPDLTTTTAVRLLLDKAADVEEAVALLERYDLHASMGMMVHFALTDAQGRAVAVEYVNDEMIVTETPALTNFYLAPGEKQGVGTHQSHTRYDILTAALEQDPVMTMDQLRDVMDSVSKDGFGGAESTEWTMLCDQSTGEVRYYHRENYETCYSFQVGGADG